MKKLTLKVEDLHVEGFQVEPDGVVNRGTVHGLDDTEACTGGACTTGCTAVGCTQYCGDSMNANSAPCFLCPRMPITYSCEDTPCC